jgi:hypothetical protein
MKWVTELNKTFSKRLQRKKSKWQKNKTKQNTQKTHEKMLTIPSHKRKVKTTLIFHLTPVRIATIKNTTTTNKCQ